MIVSGMSGNEIYCLAQKGFRPGELAVGNSVCSLGLMGGLGAFGRGLAGGEVQNVTTLISEGRHAAITRMEEEARKVGAEGVCGVTSELRTLASYTEFLAQGTAVHGGPAGAAFFSCASTGMQIYCHLDAGYHPVRFAMGNVAYALGVGRGVMGSLRTLARGEVVEFSQMYNHIRHLALQRLQNEARGFGANAVVDIQTRLLPYGAGSVELLMTGTAAVHPGFGGAASKGEDVRTSELTGEELWNLAQLGWVPVQLVMATSVYSLGVVGGIGTLFQGMSRGELPELTSLVYGARENCIRLLAEEAQRVGGEQVIGNRLNIRELSPGLIEVVAIGTAVRKEPGFTPQTSQLLPQAIIVDRSGEDLDSLIRSDPNPLATTGRDVRRVGQGARALIGIAVGLFWLLFVAVMSCMGLFADQGS
jgi:uncharacterized protein YbjQ (UPF0145 family)